MNRELNFYGFSSTETFEFFFLSLFNVLASLPSVAGHISAKVPLICRKSKMLFRVMNGVRILFPEFVVYFFIIST